MSRRAVCKRCEQNRRDATKKNLDGRLRVKANNAIRSHAEKFIRMNAVASLQEFRDHYGWSTNGLAADLGHALTRPCRYCDRPPAEAFINGLADLTVDIIDPRKEPYYRTNTLICCRTCNLEKSRTPPEQWENHRQSWREAERYAQSSPFDRGVLFDLDEPDQPERPPV